jgi:hypothetical protein
VLRRPVLYKFENFVTIQPPAGDSVGNLVKALENKKSFEITIRLNSYKTFNTPKKLNFLDPPYRRGTGG